MYLPAPFEEKMRHLLGEEYQAYLDCFEQPRHYGLRVNTEKISPEEFQKISPWKLRKIPWIPNGFYYDGEQDQPSRHPYYFAGLYYLQEPSAMTPASRLPVVPGDRVLDLCAAPGGKATELGARLRGEGLLVANDISNSRARGLLKNLELFGIGNIAVISEEPGRLTEVFPEYFDKILIDAPCSGEGMFRKERKMIRAWEEHGPEFFSRLQRSLVTQAASMLRPGGMLLYSTCTFDPLENEKTVEYLLQECPEFQLCTIDGYEGFANGIADVTDGKDPAFTKTVRIFPHRMEGEGHYLALLKKRGNAAFDETAEGHFPKNSGSSRSGRGKKLPEEVALFFEDVAWNPDPTRLELRGGRLYLMPEGLPSMQGLRTLRCGLLLGELKKNRFEPSQALAMYLKKEEYRKTLDLPAEDSRVIRYLKGETLDVSDLASPKEKGWYLLCVDGYPLGFGKLSGQTLKNKYLPGWRWMS